MTEQQARDRAMEWYDADLTPEEQRMESFEWSEHRINTLATLLLSIDSEARQEERKRCEEEWRVERAGLMSREAVEASVDRSVETERKRCEEIVQRVKDAMPQGKSGWALSCDEILRRIKESE